MRNFYTLTFLIIVAFLFNSCMTEPLKKVQIENTQNDITFCVQGITKKIGKVSKFKSEKYYIVELKLFSFNNNNNDNEILWHLSMPSQIITSANQINNIQEEDLTKLPEEICYGQNFNKLIELEKPKSLILNRNYCFSAKICGTREKQGTSVLFWIESDVEITSLKNSH